MRYNWYMQTPINAIASDPNVLELFRDALQLTFKPYDFRQFENRDSKPDPDGLTCNLSDYRTVR